MAVLVSPITGQTTDALGVNEVMGFLYADLVKLVTGADIKTRYPEFERSYGEWGAMIKEGRIPSADGTVVDPNTKEICGPFYFDADTRYYQTWVEAAYISEIRRIDVTKILRGEEEYQDLLRRVAQRNIEGYRKDVNTSIDNMFVAAAASAPSTPMALIGVKNDQSTIAAALANGGGFLNPKTPTAVNANRFDVLDEGTTYDQLWTEVLREVDHMEVENTAYTEVNQVYGADRDDLTIWAPIDLMAGTSVQYLQGLYRLTGMDQLPKIRKHNGADITVGSKKYGVIYIMDNRVINHVTRYMGYDDTSVMCRFSEQIALHVEHMLKYSPLYKAWAIVFEYPMPNEGGELVNV